MHNYIINIKFLIFMLNYKKALIMYIICISYVIFDILLAHNVNMILNNVIKKKNYH